MNAPADLQSSLAWWETVTLTATLAAAVFQIISWLFSLVAFYRKKRPHNQILINVDRRIGLERWSLNLAGVAGLVALAGAFSTIGYTRAAHKQQRAAELDSLEMHRQLTIAQQESTRASEMAKQLADELIQTKKQLRTVTQQLADADQRLSDAKERLQRVESQQKWRTLTSPQVKSMVGVLLKWKGTWLAINPVANDNEVHEFANQLDSVFKTAGWRTGWTDFMTLTNAGGAHLPEGLTLQLPERIKQHEELEKSLVTAVKIADPLAEVIYINGSQPEQQVIHLEIGRKRPSSTNAH